MKKYILLISAMLSIGATTYFSLLPLAGVSQADISNLYSTIITPAGYTFSIWSIIYISWLILGVTTLFRKETLPDTQVLVLFFAQILTAFWLIPWHFQYIGVSLIIMVIILLLLLYLVSHRVEERVFQTTVDLFTGWILVAAIANFHIFLVAFDIYSQAILIGVSSITLGVAINYYLYSVYKTIIPSLVFLWALIGILTLQTNNYIIITCLSAVIFLLCVIIMYYIHLGDEKESK